MKMLSRAAVGGVMLMLLAAPAVSASTQWWFDAEKGIQYEVEYPFDPVTGKSNTPVIVDCQVLVKGYGYSCGNDSDGHLPADFACDETLKPAEPSEFGDMYIQNGRYYDESEVDYLCRTHFKPTVTFKASSTEIVAGESVTLTWTTKDVTDVTLDGEPVSKKGSKKVTPSTAGTYIYTLTVVNAIDLSDDFIVRVRVG